MKSNGFDLEALSFKDADKIRLLLAVVIVAYCLSIHQGLKYDKQVQRKTYAGQSTSRAVSVFRKGVDLLCSQVYKLVLFVAFLYREISKAKRLYRSPKSIFV